MTSDLRPAAMAAGIVLALASAGSAPAQNFTMKFGTATVNEPLFVTGGTVELEPGGQTGRQQFRVPTFIFVIEGQLVTDYQDGPVGMKGAQYHAAGQSFMDNGGWWHNHTNRSDKPVRYLMLHLGYPGRPDPILKADKED